jgi:hypothetical protein
MRGLDGVIVGRCAARHHKASGCGGRDHCGFERKSDHADWRLSRHTHCAAATFFQLPVIFARLPQIRPGNPQKKSGFNEY